MSISSKRAYSVSEIVRLGAVSRSKLYEEINAKRLIARKIGRRTIILAEDFEQYLRSLPRL